MQFRLLDSLGLNDVQKCNQAFGCSLPALGKYSKGSEVELTEQAAAFLRGKYPGLLEPCGNVKAVPKEPVKAPAKE